MAVIVTIDKKQYTLKATARSPKLYRALIGRDMIQDMLQLAKAYKNHAETGAGFTSEDMEVLQNTVWLFAKQGGSPVGDSVDEWLDTLEGVFTLYDKDLLTKVMALWLKNVQTTATPKKK